MLVSVGFADAHGSATKVTLTSTRRLLPGYSAKPARKLDTGIRRLRRTTASVSDAQELIVTLCIMLTTLSRLQGLNEISLLVFPKILSNNYTNNSNLIYYITI